MGRAALARGWRGVAAAALAAGWASASGCAPACDNEVIRGIPSPDGVHIAFVFRRRCGPTATSTHVSVIDMQRTLKSEPGNVLAVAGDQAPKVVWRGPRQLEISGFQPPIQLQNFKVGAVDVRFRGPIVDAAP